jgi:hypothetical protein
MLQTNWTIVGLFVLFASYDIYTWVTCYGLNQITVERLLIRTRLDTQVESNVNSIRHLVNMPKGNQGIKFTQKQYTL